MAVQQTTKFERVSECTKARAEASTDLLQEDHMVVGHAVEAILLQHILWVSAYGITTKPFKMDIETQKDRTRRGYEGMWV